MILAFNNLTISTNLCNKKGRIYLFNSGGIFESGKITLLTGDVYNSHSILLKEIYGMDIEKTQRSGEITLDKSDRDQEQWYDMAIFTDDKTPYVQYLTVLETILFVGEFIQCKKDINKEEISLSSRVYVLLDDLNLLNVCNKKVSDISYQQYLTLNIACRLLFNPDIFIVDNITYRLYGVFFDYIMKVLRKYADKGCMVILGTDCISHNGFKRVDNIMIFCEKRILFAGPKSQFVPFSRQNLFPEISDSIDTHWLFSYFTLGKENVYNDDGLYEKVTNYIELSNPLQIDSNDSFNASEIQEIEEIHKNSYPKIKKLSITNNKWKLKDVKNIAIRFFKKELTNNFSILYTFITPVLIFLVTSLAIAFFIRFKYRFEVNNLPSEKQNYIHGTYVLIYTSIFTSSVFLNGSMMAFMFDIPEWFYEVFEFELHRNMYSIISLFTGMLIYKNLLFLLGLIIPIVTLFCLLPKILATKFLLLFILDGNLIALFYQSLVFLFNGSKITIVFLVFIAIHSLTPAGLLAFSRKQLMNFVLSHDSIPNFMVYIIKMYYILIAIFVPPVHINAHFCRFFMNYQLPTDENLVKQTIDMKTCLDKHVNSGMSYFTDKPISLVYSFLMLCLGLLIYLCAAKIIYGRAIRVNSRL